MLETLANHVRENWDTCVVAPLVALGALYAFVKSGDFYVRRTTEVNEENSQRYHEQQRDRHD
jgi:hypothetical protein